MKKKSQLVPSRPAIITDGFCNEKKHQFKHWHDQCNTCRCVDTQVLCTVHDCDKRGTKCPKDADKTIKWNHSSDGTVCSCSQDKDSEVVCVAASKTDATSDPPFKPVLLYEQTDNTPEVQTDNTSEDNTPEEEIDQEQTGPQTPPTEQDSDKKANEEALLAATLERTPNHRRRLSSTSPLYYSHQTKASRETRSQPSMPYEDHPSDEETTDISTENMWLIKLVQYYSPLLHDGAARAYEDTSGGPIMGDSQTTKKAGNGFLAKMKDWVTKQATDHFHTFVEASTKLAANKLLQFSKNTGARIKARQDAETDADELKLSQFKESAKAKAQENSKAKAHGSEAHGFSRSVSQSKPSQDTSSAAITQNRHKTPSRGKPSPSSDIHEDMLETDDPPLSDYLQDDAITDFKPLEEGCQINKVEIPDKQERDKSCMWATTGYPSASFDVPNLMEESKTFFNIGKFPCFPTPKPSDGLCWKDNPCTTNHNLKKNGFTIPVRTDSSHCERNDKGEENVTVLCCKENLAYHYIDTPIHEMHI